MPQKYTYAIFSALYAPHVGGVEFFTQRLARQLVIEGNHVIVVTSRLDGASAPHEAQGDGVEVYRLPCFDLLGGRLPISRINRQYKQMMHELEARGIDRVLVNVRFYRNSLEGVRFAKRIGVPVIVLDHGSAHLTLGNRVLDWFVERYEHAVTRKVMDYEPAFAGISQASAKWLGHFGIDTSHVIPNAVDVGEFQRNASQRDYKRELGIGEGQTLVAFVGRLEPEKGAIEFTQAAALLGKDYVCAMAGDGSLRCKIGSQGISNLALLGLLSQSDLSALLRDASVFCLPSRSEGFCTSLLEASAQGAVPVMTHVGGTDEVMGYDPVRFGVMLKDTAPEHIAAGIREAAALAKAQGGELQKMVSLHNSWDVTADELEQAFDSLNNQTG